MISQNALLALLESSEVQMHFYANLVSQGGLVRYLRLSVTRASQGCLAMRDQHPVQVVPMVLSASKHLLYVRNLQLARTLRMSRHSLSHVILGTTVNRAQRYAHRVLLEHLAMKECQSA
jgi:hypothetical protein